MNEIKSLLVLVLVLEFGSTFSEAAPQKKEPPSPPKLIDVNTGLPPSNKIIASIEGEPLTLKDLHDYLKAAGLNAVPQEGTEEFKKYYEDFLTQTLVEKEAKALNIEVSPDDTTAYIEEVKKQNQVNDEQLVKLLAGKGMTLAAYRLQIQQEILRTRLTQQHARTTISISEKDVKNKMGINTDLDAAVTTRHLYQVFVPIEEDGKSANFKLAETPVGAPEELRQQRLEIITQIRDKAETPQDLKSQGSSYFSDLGEVSADDLLEDLRDTVLDLDEGEVSSVLETPRGFYVLGLASVTETGPEIKADDREAAKKQLFEDRLRTEMTNYISKELPKKYNLERKL
jgi:parvulin-like peptidyl-prolyl isomerase